MSQPLLSPHHRHHHPPMASIRPCLKGASPSPSPVSSLPTSPCPTPGLQPRGVHFPAPSSLHRIHSTHSRQEYDRTPIAPPSDVERSCALPARGCPGKTYDPYAIDRIRPVATPLQGAAPALTFSGSSSEESDEAYTSMHDTEPVPAYSASSMSPRHASPSYLEMQFLPHAPSKQRRSNSPARRDEEEQRRKDFFKSRASSCKVQSAQWCEWSADDEGGCLGGF